MNQLKDFRNDPDSFDDTAPREEDASIETASHFQQEINTLKIEKLANRVTIISVILPVLIIAVVVFVYLDMKERVTDSDMTKKTQVERLESQLTEKINALDVRLAKDRFDLDNNLPELGTSLEKLKNQVAKLASDAAKAKDLNNLKARITKGDRLVKGLEKSLKEQTAQAKKSTAALAALKAQFAKDLAQSGEELQKAAGQLREDMGLFKEEFDARLLELNAYQGRIDELAKSLAFMDKKIKTLNRELETLRKSQGRIAGLENEVKSLTLKLQAATKAGKPAAKPVSKPQPKLIVPEKSATPAKDKISQDDLTQ